MAKELVKKAGVAAGEMILQSLIPQLFERLDRMEAKMDQHFAQIAQRFELIDQRFSDIDRRLDQQRLEFKEELRDTAERMVSVMSELGQPIARVEGKLELCIDTMRERNALTESLIERVVKVEVLQNTRRRKAS